MRTNALARAARAHGHVQCDAHTRTDGGTVHRPHRSAHAGTGRGCAAQSTLCRGVTAQAACTRAAGAAAGVPNAQKAQPLRGAVQCARGAHDAMFHGSPHAHARTHMPPLTTPLGGAQEEVRCCWRWQHPLDHHRHHHHHMIIIISVISSSSFAPQAPPSPPHHRCHADAIAGAVTGTS